MLCKAVLLSSGGLLIWTAFLLVDNMTGSQSARRRHALVMQKKLHVTGDASMTMELEDSTGDADILADNTMEGLEAPPELPLETALAQATAPAAAVAATPQQPVTMPAVTPCSQPHSVFPGEALLLVLQLHILLSRGHEMLVQLESKQESLLLFCRLDFCSCKQYVTEQHCREQLNWAALIRQACLVKGQN